MSVPDRAARTPFSRIQSLGRTIATGISAPVSGSGQSTSSIFTPDPPRTAHPHTIISSRVNRFAIKYDVNAPIAAIAADPEYERVVVAGREVLKILRVSSFAITEDLNLSKRRQVGKQWHESMNMPTLTAKPPRTTLQLQQLDRVIQEHKRAVNRLTFSPNNGNWLVSASQDGTMRLWDLRDSSGSAQITMEGKADAVRDITFNAANATELAASFENGVIQRWDIRRPKIYGLKLNAHNGIALSVDWHPDGKHLASGGRDKQIKIWNFHSDNRKPQQTLQTMAPVVRVLWRPSEGTTELASCSLQSFNAIQIWNLKRPYVPSRLLDEHDNVATGIVWNNEDVLWSSSKDKTFVRHDIRTASRPLTNLPPSAVAWSPRGELFYTTDLRKTTRSHVHFDSSAPLEDDPPSQESRRGIFFNPARATTPVSTANIPFDVHIPQHLTTFISFPSTSTSKFDILAKIYVTTCDESMSFSEACKWNSQAALRIRDYRTSQTWTILMQIYTWFEDDIHSARLKRTEKSTNQKSVQLPDQDHSGQAQNESILDTRITSPSSISPRIQIEQPHRRYISSSEKPCILFEDISDLSSTSEKSESPIQQHALARTASPMRKLSTNDTGSPRSPYPDPVITQTYNSQHRGCPESYESSRSGSTQDHSTESARDTEGEVTEVHDRMKDSLITVRPATGLSGASTLLAKPQYVQPVLEPTWTFKAVFRQLFDYYILLGDVQMAATLSLLIGDDIELPAEQVRQLISGYIGIPLKSSISITLVRTFTPAGAVCYCGRDFQFNINQ
ncbi:WD repeat-containing protein 24 [Neolecta irregularis DAH-3]|uniref:WD repeat-containing protein 24 n=1 Tax=Neolecta irregularis (strain DAH-3) TaxID=1198029 RepID=A0A1U7LPQ2_NEOID|nr:WD repeat-containing protein 24 [Neolecta irregularis DAH-3]|eukprot:OLL24522.1 WD repeat-containing protein 24 [Neolecta irregularis DAH-3]